MPSPPLVRHRGPAGDRSKPCVPERLEDNGHQITALHPTHQQETLVLTSTRSAGTKYGAESLTAHRLHVFARDVALSEMCDIPRAPLELDDPHELARFAATAHLSLEEFKEKFEYLVQDEPPPLELAGLPGGALIGMRGRRVQDRAAKM